MSHSQKVTISIWGNNQSLVDSFVSQEMVDISFRENQNGLYLLVTLDLDTNQDQISSNLYSLLADAQSNKKKVLICLFFSQRTTPDQINRFLEIFSGFSQKQLNLRVLLIKDLYDLTKDTCLGFFDCYIKQAVQSGQIKISKTGKNNFQPQKSIDLTPHIKKLLFLNSTQSQNFIINSFKISDLELGYLLKKYYEEYYKQNFEIDSEEKEKQQSPFESIKFPYQILDSQNSDETLENDLKHYLLDEAKKQSNQHISDSSSHKRPNKAKKIYQNFKSKIKGIFDFQKEQNLHQFALKILERVFLKTLLVTIFIYLFSSFLFVTSTYYTLKSLQSSSFYLKKGDISASSKYFKQTNLSQKVAESNFQIINPLLKLINPNVANLAFKINNFAEYTTNSLENILQNYNLLEKVYYSLNTPHYLNYQEMFTAIKSNFQQEYESLNQLEILLEDPVLPTPIVELVKKNDQYSNLTSLKKSAWESSRVLDLFPELLGTKKNANIILLIQNQNELRSTGGTIDFLVHLSIDNGRLIFQKIYTPQEIDNLSDLKIDAPPLIEKVTGESRWRLRDMNYNPDFPQTAVNISWYLERKINTKPDAIISIGTNYLLEILKNENLAKSLGIGIKYTDYQSELENGLAQNSTKVLIDTFLQKVLNHNLPLIDLLELTLLKNNYFNLWINNSALQQALYSQPLSGTINKQMCLPAMASARKCYAQTIHLNFSNFSSISLNSYLDRNFSLVVTPQALSIEHELTIESEYRKSTPLINRNLVEVVQLYLNKENSIKSITINDKTLNQNDLIVSEEVGLNRYQFVISSELNKTSTLKINYSTILPERTILPVAYTYNIIQQSGYAYAKKNIEINLPDSVRASAVTSKVDNLPNKIMVDLKDKNSFGFNLVSR